jgi:hypothetical protein
MVSDREADPAPQGDPEADQPSDRDRNLRQRLQIQNVAHKEAQAAVRDDGAA